MSFPIIIIINLDAKRRVYGAEVENTYLTSNYIDENTGKILSPKLEVLLANYNLLMSSVPGLPINLYDQNIWNDDNIKTIGKINISAKKTMRY
ncbi:MAG: hypothetical protein BHV99_03635 [Clostridium sp. 26_21]|nr:MAG: hypothetical protein BHV99_03635 [Clostridium sp. 26_21]